MELAHLFHLTTMSHPVLSLLTANIVMNCISTSLYQCRSVQHAHSDVKHVNIARVVIKSVTMMLVSY